MVEMRLAVSLLLLSSCCVCQQLPELAGQSGTLTLLSDISSRQPKNTRFEAKLPSDLRIEKTTILPQGTLFEGHVEPERARRHLRQGSLRLVFDRMIFPDGQARPVNAVVTYVPLKSVSTDAEGVIHAKRSNRRLAIQLGTTALIAKTADDLSEVASASVTKNSARFFGLAGAAAFLLLQRGADVKMPAGTSVDVLFQRPADRGFEPSTDSSR